MNIGNRKRRGEYDVAPPKKTPVSSSVSSSTPLPEKEEKKQKSGRKKIKKEIYLDPTEPQRMKESQMNDPPTMTKDGIVENFSALLNMDKLGKDRLNVQNVSLDILRSGINVPLNSGDSLADVLRFWCHAVLEPEKVFPFDHEQWMKKEVLRTNMDLMYGNFTRYIMSCIQKEEDNLFSRGVNFDLLEDDQKQEFRKMQEANRSSPSTITSRDRFANATKFIFGTNVRVHENAVDIPCHFAMQLCLIRFSTRMENATQSLLDQLVIVREAHVNDLKMQHLNIAIQPDCTVGKNMDDFLVCYTNCLAETTHERLRRWTTPLKDMSSFHPLFKLECWKKLFFMCGLLALQKGLVINFKYDVGQHYQYLTIYDGSFDLDTQEFNDTTGTKTGGHEIFYSLYNVSDVDSLKVWQYEYCVHEQQVKGRTALFEALPYHQGTKVKFMFLENFRWFFFC